MTVILEYIGLLSGSWTSTCPPLDHATDDNDMYIAMCLHYNLLWCH